MQLLYYQGNDHYPVKYLMVSIQSQPNKVRKEVYCVVVIKWSIIRTSSNANSQTWW